MGVSEDGAASITPSDDRGSTVPGNVRFCHITKFYMPEEPTSYEVLISSHINTSSQCEGLSWTRVLSSRVL